MHLNEEVPEKLKFPLNPFNEIFVPNSSVINFRIIRPTASAVDDPPLRFILLT